MQINNIIITESIEKTDLIELLDGDYMDAAKELIEYFDLYVDGPIEVSFVIENCPIKRCENEN